jgi:hypothetical protein
MVRGLNGFCLSRVLFVGGKCFKGGDEEVISQGREKISSDKWSAVIVLASRNKLSSVE